MNKRSAIFISIEGLGTNLVGAYGSSVAPTPRIDSLASRSIILDQLWNDSLGPADVLRSWWSGRHYLESTEMSPSFSPWLEAIGQALLVTDSEVVAQSDAVEHVAQVFFVENSNSPGADDPEHSNDGESEPTLEFEHLLQAALGAWHAKRDEHPVLWIHSKGLAGRWDAPYELREMLCDEEDPAPPRDTIPLTLKITPKTDPDEVFQISCAVGGQIMAYDRAIGECYDMIEELGDSSECLFAVLGTNGFPLGEHGEVGQITNQLYSESLHVPCIIRTGSVLPLGIRLSVNLQPHQVGNLLNDWFSPAIDEQQLYDSQLQTLTPEVDGESPLGTAIASQGDAFYICAPAWALTTKPTPEGMSPRVSDGEEFHELFVKPDDRWEQNDVSSRASSALEKMYVLREKLKEFYTSGPLDRPPVNWLDEELTKIQR